MLFLLNDYVVSIGSPEVHLMQNWRTMGCGHPRDIQAQDAIDFAVSAVAAGPVSHDMAINLAALIISKTGANSIILKPAVSGGLEPRLRHLPPLVLETYARGAANDSNRAAIAQMA